MVLLVLLGSCSDNEEDQTVRVDCELPEPSGANDQNGTLTVGDTEFSIIDTRRNEAMNTCTRRIRTALADACEDRNGGSIALIARYRDFDDKTAEERRQHPCP